MKKLLFFFLSSFSSLSLAQEMGDFGEPGKQNTRLSLKQTSDFWFEQNQNVDESKQLALKQLDASLYVPVYQIEGMSYALHAKSQHLHLNNMPVAQNNFPPVQDLYETNFGATWAYKENAETNWTATFSYGSASDKPFDAYDVTTISATLIRKKALDSTASLSYFLNYSNNRSILNNIPLPGFAYSYVAEDKTQGYVLGFPFLTYWARPTAETSFSATYIIPSGARLAAGYMVLKPLQINLKLERFQQSYMRAGRSEKDERIFYEQQKIATSAKFFFGKQRFVELELARISSRSLYNGKSALDVTSDRLKLPDEWQASLAIQVAL